MRYGKQTKTRMIDIFDALKSLPTVYDERLMDLEARLFEDDCDQNYYSKKRSDHKKSFDLDMDRLLNIDPMGASLPSYQTTGHYWF